jgi:DNA cross-link repair 1C protein
VIEDEVHAVLYTGDTRSEPWFVNSLLRNPNLVEYTSGLRRLDKIYLDTSFTRDVTFQSKAEGIAELLGKVKQYPEDTVFRFQAWTYGYEDVWIALSKALNTCVHVDDYKLRIYRSLTTRTPGGSFVSEAYLSPEAPALTGFLSGNSIQPGCLTANENVRLHSCEKGNMCRMASQPNVVKIQPIIAHLPGGDDLSEVGIGGGGDDLEREGELDATALRDLDGLFDRLRSSDIHAEVWDVIKTTLSKAAVSGRNLALKLDAASCGGDLATTVQSAIKAMARRLDGSSMISPSKNEIVGELPRVIQFPYSRHSSYPELCHLVEIFRPKDIWPCTVDIDEWIKSETTIQSLFGQYCSGTVFAHDIKMKEYAERTTHILDQAESQNEHTQQSFVSLATSSSFSPRDDPTSEHQSSQPPATITDPPQSGLAKGTQPSLGRCKRPANEEAMPPTSMHIDGMSGTHVQPCKKSRHDLHLDPENEPTTGDSQESNCSLVSSMSVRDSITRWEAYYQTISNARSEDWQPVSLISTKGGHSQLEHEM